MLKPTISMKRASEHLHFKRHFKINFSFEYLRSVHGDLYLIDHLPNSLLKSPAYFLSDIFRNTQCIVSVCSKYLTKYRNSNKTKQTNSKKTHSGFNSQNLRSCFPPEGNVFIVCSKS